MNDLTMDGAEWDLMNSWRKRRYYLSLSSG